MNVVVSLLATVQLRENFEKIMQRQQPTNSNIEYPESETETTKSNHFKGFSWDFDALCYLNRMGFFRMIFYDFFFQNIL